MSMEPTTRICKTCGVEKELSAAFFRKIVKGDKVYYPWECYECGKPARKKSGQKYYQDNKEELDKANKQYYEENKEVIHKQTKQYRKNNKEKLTAYQKQ